MIPAMNAAPANAPTAATLLQSRFRAARLHASNESAPGAEGPALVIEDVRLPAMADTDVIVDVMACGVTPTLKVVVEGAHRVVTAPLPATLGSGVSGVVRATGPRARGVR